MPKRIGSNNAGGRALPISRTDILFAQQHTRSNMEAARYLGVGYMRYRKYAKIYGLFDGHLNQTGIGVSKGFSKKASSIPLRDIFANKHPAYNLLRLKNRMIARDLLVEECSLCKFNEKRITDKKTPLILTFRNGKKDFTRDNLHLLCYNCLFLTTGAPTVANRGYIEKSFSEPEKIPKRWNVTARQVDSIDIGEPDSNNTPDQFHDIRDEILKELGRD